jgi:hypothetical protein
MLRQWRRNGRVNPETMGPDWHNDGPKVSGCDFSPLAGPLLIQLQRFRQEHDWFWQEAYRVGENYRQGYSPAAGTNPFLAMHQNWPDDVDDWIRNDPIIFRRRPRTFSTSS